MVRHATLFGPAVQPCSRVHHKPVLAEDEPQATREASCSWAKTPPTIDGRLDEPVWESASRD